MFPRRTRPAPPGGAQAPYSPKKPPVSPSRAAKGLQDARLFAQLEEKIRLQREELSKRSEEFIAVERDVGDLSSKMDGARDDVLSIHGQFRRACENLKGRDATIADLRQQIAALTQRAKDADADAAAARSDAAEARSDAAEARRVVAELRASAVEHHARIAELEAGNADLAARVADREAQLKAAADRSEALAAENTEQANLVHFLEGELALKQGQLQTTTDHIGLVRRVAEQEGKDKRDQVQRLTEQLAATRKELLAEQSAHREAVDALQAARQATAAAEQLARGSAQEAEAKTVQLEGKIAELIKRVRDESRAAYSANGVVAKLQKEKQVLQARIVQMEADRERVHNINERQFLSRLEFERGEAASQRADLEARLGAAQSGLEEASERLARAEKQLAAQTAQNEQQLAEIARLGAVLEQRAVVDADAAAQLQRMDKDRSALVASKATLESLLADARRELEATAETRREVQIKDAELSKLTEQLTAKSSELHRLHEQVQQLSQALRKASEDLETERSQGYEPRMQKLLAREKELQNALVKIQAAEEASEPSVTCLACLGPLADAVTLNPCGHTFCRTCLDGDKCRDCDAAVVAVTDQPRLDNLASKYVFKQQCLDGLMLMMSP